MTTYKISRQNLPLVQALIDHGERVRAEHQEIHARAERECAALHERSKVEMTQMFKDIGNAEGVFNMDVPDFSIETKFLKEHGLAFLEDGLRERSRVSFGGMVDIPTEEIEPACVPTSHRKH